MKKYFLIFGIFGLCVFGPVAAAAQGISGSLANSQPQMLVFAEHPQHASQIGLAPEQDLRERSTYTFAHGERPLWELMPLPPPGPSLGDLARVFRSEHAMAKKAIAVWKD